MAHVAHYSASKHAVIGLTRAAAIEYAKQNIRVNAISPAGIETDMLDRFTGHDKAAMAFLTGLHPMGRIGKAREIASNVGHLCSDAASFDTGYDFVVDGGFTAQ